MMNCCAEWFGVVYIDGFWGGVRRISAPPLGPIFFITYFDKKLNNKLASRMLGLRPCLENTGSATGSVCVRLRSVMRV